MDIVEVQAKGHLTECVMGQLLSDVEYNMPDGDFGILFLTSDMCGYDMGARPVFIQWLNKNVDRVRRLAIVSEKQLWHLLLSSMANSIDTKMAIFYEEEGARDWLSS